MSALDLPPARVERITVIEPLPIGEATELAGAVVRVLPQRHGWDAWDIATMTMDLDPMQATAVAQEA